MNIRKIGSYEIVVYDENDQRIKEFISNDSLVESEKLANELSVKHNAYSYTISSILRNTKFSVWSAEK